MIPSASGYSLGVSCTVNISHLSGGEKPNSAQQHHGSVCRVFFRAPVKALHISAALIRRRVGAQSKALCSVSDLLASTVAASARPGQKQQQLTRKAIPCSLGPAQCILGACCHMCPKYLLPAQDSAHACLLACLIERWICCFTLDTLSRLLRPVIARTLICTGCCRNRQLKGLQELSTVRACISFAAAQQFPALQWQHRT